jgi:hypothetical protein
MPSPILGLLALDDFAFLPDMLRSLGTDNDRSRDGYGVDQSTGSTAPAAPDHDLTKAKA